MTEDNSYSIIEAQIGELEIKVEANQPLSETEEVFDKKLEAVTEKSKQINPSAPTHGQQ